MGSEIIVDGLNIFGCLQLVSKSLIAEGLIMQNTNYEFPIDNFTTIGPIFQDLFSINQILQGFLELSLSGFEDSLILKIEQIIKKLGYY